MIGVAKHTINQFEGEFSNLFLKIQIKLIIKTNIITYQVLPDQ